MSLVVGLSFPSIMVLWVAGYFRDSESRVEPPCSAAPLEDSMASQPPAEGGSPSVISVCSAQGEGEGEGLGRPRGMALGAGVFVWCWLALLSEPGSGGSPSHTWHGLGDPPAAARGQSSCY